MISFAQNSRRDKIIVKKQTVVFLDADGVLPLNYMYKIHRR